MKKDFPSPPRAALRFLEWYCPSSLHEGIEGDLLEQFEKDLQSPDHFKWPVDSISTARRRFILNVFKFFRPEIILRNKRSQNLFQTDMLQNYFKIAFRSLWRAKAHSSINVLGLALGIACCVLIALFVHDELTFDTFHAKANRIYRVYARENWGAKQEFFYTFTPFPMGPTLKENLPEVEYQVRINNVATQVKVGENQFNETVVIGGQDFFRAFDFKIVAGDKASALSGQSNLVLSEGMARKYFGDRDPINKTISLQLGENFEDFTVKAVAERTPSNSSIQFDILISDLNYPRLYNQNLLTSSWFNIVPETYVVLKAGVDPRTVEGKFPSVFRTILGADEFAKSKYAPGLQPLTDIHLNTDYPAGMAPVSNPKYSYILAAIALLILSVACINFVTLSVGRSLQRAKEVGIRKVVGAMRNQLITQFIGEAILVTLIAMIMGVGLSYLNLPVFNDLSGKQLVFQFNQFTIVVIASLLLIIGLISGSYPAFVLSAFRPIAVLKGSLQAGSSRQGVRKVLVGIQLALSIFLISSTLLMRKQLSFLQNKDMGFDKEQLAEIQLNVPRGRLPERVKAGFEKVERFKTELARFPDILAVCGSSHDFGNGNWTNVGYTDDKNVYRTFNLNVVDDEFIPALKMALTSGRNFSDENPSDKRRSVIINEAFAKEYNWKDPIGKKIPGKNFQDHEVIGVVKDFNYASLYTKVEPLVMVEDPTIILSGIENINIDNSPVPKLMIRFKPGNMGLATQQVKETWNKIAGEEEFSMTFVDQTMARQYRHDQNLGKIVSVATILSILIGSLGLYALASLAMHNRTKEISIRKVMGANDQSLLVLLSKEYLYMVAVCLLISVPITWYLMKNWLSTFEYRIGISPDVFILAGGISLLIALATISFQTLKTVWTNPVKSLKYE
jgi:putative ABC transport system permease protein